MSDIDHPPPAAPDPRGRFPRQLGRAAGAVAAVVVVFWPVLLVLAVVGVVAWWVW